MRVSTILTGAVLLFAVPAVAQTVEGSTSAVFQNPTPATAVITGVGTASFTFGTPPDPGASPNQTTFRGGAFSSALETPFRVGTLSYFNGSTLANTGADGVDLALTLAFTQPILPDVLSAFRLNFVRTENTGDPDGDADFLFFPSSFSTSEFLIDGTTYRIRLTGFDNIIGDGFLTSNSTRLHVRENASATADLFAVVTAQAVPELGAWAMMIVGMGATGVALRRERRVRAAV